MKGFLLAFFIPALLIVSDAKFADSSIIDTSDKCQSALRVKVLGIGQDISVPRARESCERSCGEGFNSFYLKRCPELCGIGPKTKKVSGQSKCTLCYPDKDKFINDCRSLISLGLFHCVRVCKSAKPFHIGDEIRVQGTSGKWRKSSPVKCPTEQRAAV